MKAMKIVKLEAENVKRLSAVEIKPDGSLVVIGGNNGAGKTSVLDSIAYALGGKNLCPAKPIREGEEKAFIRVDLGEMVVERTFTEKDSYLKVSGKNGSGGNEFVAKSPQALLDGLVGKLTFDPLAFATMPGSERKETLQALDPDLSAVLSKLETERAEVFEDRRTSNRQVKELKAQIKGMPEHEGVPDAPVSVSDLMADLQGKEDINRSNTHQRQELEVLQAQARNIQTERDRVLAEMADLEKKVEAQTKTLDEITATGTAAAEEVGKLQDADIDSVRQQIAEADKINERVRSNLARQEMATSLKKTEAKAGKLGDKLSAIDEKKVSALAAAKFPVEGLAFDEEGVTFNGLPFDQSSQAEKLRVSVAMGLAMNPDLRVMLIRDGSLLDTDNLTLIAKMAEEADAQIWIERVGDGPEVSVLIEDGMVAKEPVEVS